MRSLLRNAALAILSLAVCPAATITVSGPGQFVPDYDSSGITLTLNVNTGFYIQGMRLWLQEFSHTWIGDLVMTLEHDANTVYILNRPGQSTVGGLGYSADFAPGGTYGFQQGGNSLDSAAMSSTVIPFGDYAPAGNLGVFQNTNAIGAWTLRVSDLAQLDLSSSQWTWGLDFEGTPIPEPATGYLAAGVLGALVAVRRWRA